VVNVERLHHNKTEYRLWTREFEGLLDRICIFHPRETTRLEIVTDCKGLQMRS
jgi:hypothetical protein